ncbi:MAG: hypothetical protein RL732_925, partial [Bacteroidota bacterium]
MRRTFLACLAVGLTVIQPGWSQLPPIGQWREHLNWSACFRVCGDNATVWAATVSGVLKIEREDNSIHRLSKVNGLSSSGIRDIAWDSSTASLVVIYANAFIDVVQNERVDLIPSIRQAMTNNQKDLWSVICRNGLAYVSSSLGIIVVDLKKNEVRETYKIGSNGDATAVYAVALNGNDLYASTAEGLKRCPTDKVNPADFRNWESLSGKLGLPEGPTAQTFFYQDELFVVQHNTLYRWSETSWLPIYTKEWDWKEVQASNTGILIGEVSGASGRVRVLNRTGNTQLVLQDPVYTRSPSSVIHLRDTYWIADTENGLSTYQNGTFTTYRPNAPQRTTLGPAVFTSKALWMASRDINQNWQPETTPAVILRFEQEKWETLTASAHPEWPAAGSFSSIASNPANDMIWLGSLGKGLFSLENNNQLKERNQNSPLGGPSGSQEPYWVSGLAIDKLNQLWVSNYGANYPLQVRKADGNWRSFRPPFSIESNAFGKLIIDDQGQKWVILEKKQGLACFSDGTTPDNPADDQWKWYKAGKGIGNLPDNDVRCLAKDLNNFIWVGTSKGIGIIPCAESVFSNADCEALLPVVKQGNFNGYLLNDEVVQCITVDGADRKWIGTRNGVWLISAEGEQTIFHFDE